MLIQKIMCKNKGTKKNLGVGKEFLGLSLKVQSIKEIIHLFAWKFMTFTLKKKF